MKTNPALSFKIYWKPVQRKIEMSATRNTANISSMTFWHAINTWPLPAGKWHCTFQPWSLVTFSHFLNRFSASWRSWDTIRVKGGKREKNSSSRNRERDRRILVEGKHSSCRAPLISPVLEGIYSEITVLCVCVCVLGWFFFRVVPPS